jgi:hypothetical protein
MSATNKGTVHAPCTCATTGRVSCAPCMEFEVDLWDAIHRYVIACGGDPGKHVHGNVPRMDAVADVSKIVAREVTRRKIDAGTIVVAGAGPSATGAAYEAAKELARMWRDQRTAPFDLLDRLAGHFAAHVERTSP